MTERPPVKITKPKAKPLPAQLPSDWNWDDMSRWRGSSVFTAKRPEISWARVYEHWHLCAEKFADGDLSIPGENILRFQVDVRNDTASSLLWNAYPPAFWADRQDVERAKEDPALWLRDRVWGSAFGGEPKGPRMTALALADARAANPEVAAAIFIRAWLFELTGARGHDVPRSWCGAPFGACESIEAAARTKVDLEHVEWHHAMTRTLPLTDCSGLTFRAAPERASDIVAVIALDAAIMRARYKIIMYETEKAEP